jgi:hypothetical protein
MRRIMNDSKPVRITPLTGEFKGHKVTDHTIIRLEGISELQCFVSDRVFPRRTTHAEWKRLREVLAAEWVWLEGEGK